MGNDGVRLRDVADDDVPIFFEHGRDPRAVHMAALTAADPSDGQAFRAHWALIRGDASVTVRTILFGGRVAGFVAVFGPPDEREITYWVGAEFWGRGVATAALSQFLREQPARPVRARAAKDNVASLRVLQKCGFTVTGYDRAFAHGRGGEVGEGILRLG